MRCQRILESKHNVGMMPPGFQISAGVVGRQAIDKPSVKHLIIRRISSCFRDRATLI
jgi:hypothetical protein